MFNLSTAEPDYSEDHYAECATQTDHLAECDCPEIDRAARRAFAANVADWKNDAQRCY